MKRIVVFLLVVVMFFTGCGQDKSSKETIKEDETAIQEVVKPKEIPTSGVVNPIVEDYGERYIAVMDHYGWFLYDKNEDKIIGAFGLGHYGFTQTQGDDAVQSYFKEDEMAAYFWKGSRNSAYRYNIGKGTVQRLVEERQVEIENDKERENTTDSKGELIIKDLNPKNMIYKDKNNGKEYHLLENYNIESPND